MANTTAVYDGGPITELLALNQAWAQSTNVYFPALFPKLATGQVPKILWIGCCDSRVPETQLLGLLPGEVFVHRNIANLYHPSDYSLPAALHYAVEEIKVSHVIVCGHIGCGGVKAASSATPVGIIEIDRWLDPLRVIRQDHYNMITNLAAAAQQPALVKLSVQRSLAKLATISAVADAIKIRPLQLHGAIYDVGTGLFTFLSPEESTEPPSESFFDLTKYYNLSNKSGGPTKFLDIQGGNLDANGTGSGYPNQNWRFSPVGDGSFAMSTAGLLGYVASFNGAGKPLTVVTPPAPSTNAGQRWRLNKADDGVSYFLTNDLGGPTLRLDVNQATYQPAFFPMMSTATAPGQYWTFKPTYGF